MNDLPLVSVCIPAHRAERYLAETLASVRAQSFTNWELVLVEDGSRDGTEEIVKAFASEGGQPVRYIRNEGKGGPSVARNMAIGEALAPWIALLDADDLWMPDHLEDLLSIAEKNTAHFVHSACVMFEDASGKDLYIRAPSKKSMLSIPMALFDGRYVIQPSSVLLRRDCWLQLGGFSSAIVGVEDREMWIRCVRAGIVPVYSGRATCRYRKHADSLSQNAAKMAEANALVFDLHRDWEVIPREVSRRLTAQAWTAAARLRQRMDPEAAARYYSRALAVEWTFEWWVRLLACRVLASNPFRSRKS